MDIKFREWDGKLPKLDELPSDKRFNKWDLHMMTTAAIVITTITRKISIIHAVLLLG